MQYVDANMPHRLFWEVNLEKQAKQYSEFVEIVPLPLLILAPNDGEILYANSAAQDTLGQSLRGLRRHKMCELVQDETILKSLIERVKENRTSASASQIIFVNPNQNEVTADVIASYNEDDDIISLMLWPQDNNGQIKDKAYARQKDKSIGHIGRALAHEVKNPLAGIRGAAQLMMHDASASQKPLASLIIDETDRIHRLMDKVESLGFELPPNLVPVNIHETLDKVIKLAQNSFAQNLSITRNFDVSLPSVLGEPDLLTQIFLNLGKNAAEAANEKNESGMLIFATKYNHGLRIRNSEGEKILMPIEITIVDNGYGVPSELKDLIFDPFVSTKPEGTGLGLALVRKLVSSHNGVIEFDSLPGRTVFRVRLPSAQ